MVKLFEYNNNQVMYAKITAKFKKLNTNWVQIAMICVLCILFSSPTATNTLKSRTQAFINNMWIIFIWIIVAYPITTFKEWQE